MKHDNWPIKLDPSSKKFECPNCGKKRFVRYIDSNTGTYLPNMTYGRCDRVDNCGYVNSPKKDALNAMNIQLEARPPIVSKPKEEFYYHPAAHMLATLGKLKHNHLFQALMKIPGMSKVELQKAFEAYHVGTVGQGKRFEGSPIFWKLDQYGRILTGKIICYDKSGHRLKNTDGNGLISSARSQIRPKPSPELANAQALYGESLLPHDLNKPVAIVESEKTALISSIYFPDFLWLASGSKSNLNLTDNAKIRMRPVKARTIVLFPDQDAIDLWARLALDWAKIGYNIRVSTLVRDYDHLMPDKQNKDLADLLPLFHLHRFRNDLAPYPPQWDDVKAS